MLRRRSSDGASLETTFVTVFEPLGPRPGIRRVGRLESPPGTVVLLLETAGGAEHLVVNLTPGTRQTVRLSGGEPLQTDGLAVRETAGGPGPGRGDLRRDRPDGSSASPGPRGRSAGPSAPPRETPGAGSRPTRPCPSRSPSPAAPCSIRHGDGTTRGWTLVRVENTPDGRARLLVREEPGFQIDPESRDAVYYQFPGTRIPGPHRFRVARIAR